MLANRGPAIALVLSLLVKLRRAERLAAPKAVFEEIHELEFDHPANLTAEAGPDQLLHNVGVDAELIPELEIDQILGW